MQIDIQYETEIAISSLYIQDKAPELIGISYRILKNLCEQKKPIVPIYLQK